MVVLRIGEHFNYKGILMNKKLMALVVGLLSFGAVQAMDFLDQECVDLKPAVLVHGIFHYSIIPFIAAGNFEQVDAYKTSLQDFLNRCGPGKLDLNYVYFPTEGKSIVVMVDSPVAGGIFVSLYSAIAWWIDCNKDNDQALAFLREVKEILNRYQPEVFPEGGYAWDPRRKELKPKELNKGTLLLGVATGALVIGWGIYRVFFAEEKKRSA